MSKCTVFDYERCRLSGAVAEEQDVMADTQAYHDVQVCLFPVEDFCLEYRVAEYIPV